MICPTGKVQFRSRTEATENNKIVGRNKGIYHYTYHCDICGDYHLASRGKRTKLSNI